MKDMPHAGRYQPFKLDKTIQVDGPTHLVTEQIAGKAANIDRTEKKWIRSVTTN